MKIETQVKKYWLAAIILTAFAGIGLWLLTSSCLVLHKQVVLKQTVNDLKWVGLALHQYHDTYHSFPPAVVYGKDQITPHSWRALIEPYFALPGLPEKGFAQYDFSKPWNRQPDAPSQLLDHFDNHSYQFLAVVGREAAWSDKQPRRINEITDGTSNTILLIAIRNTGVRWHQPQDISVKGTSLFIGDRPVDLSSDAFVLTADGSTHYFGNGLAPPLLAQMLTIAGGEKADL